MNDLIDKIIERPKGQKIAILAVAVLLLIGLYYTLLYGPRSEDIARLEEQVESAKNERLTKQQKAANLPRLRKELTQLDIDLKRAVAQLPDKKSMDELLRTVASKAQQAGLDVILFRPRAENMQDFYAEIPIDITVKGNFYSAVNFFDQVGRLDRLININNIGFKKPATVGDTVMLETTTVATAFRFLSEAERKKIAEEKAKAAQQKK